MDDEDVRFVIFRCIGCVDVVEVLVIEVLEGEGVGILGDLDVVEDVFVYEVGVFEVFCVV